MQVAYKIAGGDFLNAGNAASSVKKILHQLNVPPRIVRRVVVAMYEGEVNIVAHAWSGTAKVKIDTEKINIVFQDSGPGIENIDQAMEEGYTTATPQVREMGFGAGMGLSNMKKNSDEMYISSELGKGTRVELINFLQENAE